MSQSNLPKLGDRVIINHNAPEGYPGIRGIITRILDNPDPYNGVAVYQVTFDIPIDPIWFTQEYFALDELDFDGAGVS